MQNSEVDSATANLKPSQKINPPKSSSVTEEDSSDSAPRIERSEIRRKILHIMPGFAPFFLAFLPHGPTLTNEDLIFVGVIIVIFVSLFMFFRKQVERTGEKNLVSTVYTYAAVIAFVLVFFRDHAEFASVVTVIIAFGDTAAYVGGKLYGKTKLPWNPDKSWMGMLWFVIFSAPFAAIAFYLQENPASSIQLAIVCAFTASIVGCLAETINTSLTDNFRVGVGAAIGVSVSYFMFQGILV